MSAGDGILVKDYDGTLKVLRDGELKEYASLLEESSVFTPTALTISPPHLPMVTTGGTPPPSSPHFQENEARQGSGIRELHFHPDDRQDVEQELAKLQQLTAGSQQQKYSIEKIARKLADKQKLTLSDADFQAFTRALLSFFRQMRSAAEIRARLSHPTAEGGLGIAEAAVDGILTVATFLKQKIEEADGTVVAEGAYDVDDAPVPTKPPQTTLVMPSPPTVSGVSSPTSSPLPITQQQQPAVPRSSTSPASRVESITRVEPISTPLVKDLPSVPRVQRPSGGFAPIPVVEDVKRPARPSGFMRTRQQSPLTGRVEELAGMTLELWRILDPNPRIRAGKILGKIQNLERESFTRKSQGIDAWRQSPAHQLYLQLGSMSLEQGTNVEHVIESLTKSGAETLTIDEFEAISDLNRMLRF